MRFCDIRPHCPGRWSLDKPYFLGGPLEAWHPEPNFHSQPLLVPAKVALVLWWPCYTVFLYVPLSVKLHFFHFSLLQVFFFRSKCGNLWLFLLCVLIAQSFLTLWDPMICSSAGSSCPFPGKNTGVGCHSLLQRIFLTQEWNPGLLHCRQILYWLSHQGSPLIPVRFYVI